MTDDSMETVRLAEQALAAAREEASRRIDEGLAQARAKAREIIDAAHEDAERIRRTAAEELAEERASNDELRAALLELCEVLSEVGVRLGDGLDACQAELRALRGPDEAADSQAELEVADEDDDEVRSEA